MKFTVIAFCFIGSTISLSLDSVLAAETTNSNAHLDGKVPYGPSLVDDSRTIHPMPPNPQPYQVTYDDGTKSPPIVLKARGEITSSSHEIYEETLDGFVVQLNVNSNMYTYLDVDPITGALIDTGLVAGHDSPYLNKVTKSAATKSHEIKATSSPVKQDSGSHRKLHDNSIDIDLQQHQHRRAVITSGTLKNLVIPFKFSDHTSRNVPSRADLDTLMNNAGPDALCPTGSVRDVYLESSFNQLDLNSTVVDWVTIDYTEADCASSSSGLLTQFHVCIKNALEKVAAAGVDFGDYDLDGDSYIDGIAFFHSGYGAEWGGTDSYGTPYTNRIWSHKWAIWGSNSFSNNGVTVYEYHISPALWATSGSDIGRIGVVAHETGHFLGLPDLYDYGAGSGIGSYGMMANSWGFDGSQYYPPLMSAWAKYVLGWVTPTVVSSSGSFSLSQACDNADMIMINAGYPSGEYLLIENRQSCGFDESMSSSGGGLAIFHIDSNANNVLGYPGQTNWPTNGDHYNVALLQADGLYGLEKGWDRGDATDLFRAGHVDSIGPAGTSLGDTYPNTKAYQGGTIIDTEVTISNISTSQATMTFDITIGASSSSPTVAPTVTATSSPTASPTKAPVPATSSPTKSPTVSPTASPTKAPVDSSTCVDSSTKVLIKLNNGKWRQRTCFWVKKRPARRCTFDGASEGCPSTCGTCGNQGPTEAPTMSPTVSPTASPTKAPVDSSTCVDSSTKVLIKLNNGKWRLRTCFWVKKRPAWRCTFDGASEGCPSTCGTCQ